MMECFHPATSLLQRAQTCQLHRLVALIRQHPGSAADATTHQVQQHHLTNGNAAAANNAPAAAGVGAEAAGGVIDMDVEELGPM